MPKCPECLSDVGEACVDDNGRVRAPHRARTRVACGEIFVIYADDARARRQLRTMRELAASMPVKRKWTSP